MLDSRIGLGYVFTTRPAAWSNGLFVFVWFDVVLLSSNHEMRFIRLD